MENETFHTSENTLDDGSKTYDVYFSSSYGQELIAEPPSLAAAEFLAEALNAIRTEILNCGSDREAENIARLVRRLFAK